MPEQVIHAFQKVKYNPFDNDIINQPREVTFSVSGLNDRPLRELVDKFSELEVPVIPRGLVHAPKAQLVVSPDRGYGKSHLLGRLFQKLDDRATQIYLRPFQSTNSVFHSILLATVQELQRTDNPGEESESNPLQIEAFARGVLAHIVADYIDQGDVKEYDQAKEAVAFLREHPLDVSRMTSEYSNWAKWIEAIFEAPSEFSKLKARLTRRLIDGTGVVPILDGRESAWLKILYAYAYSPKDSDQREAVLKWLRAEPLEDKEVESLKLTQADNDVKPEMSVNDIDSISLRRLKGLCALAGFYRPFLFCFDQIEYYSREKSFVETFGITVEQFFADFRNQMTVVTTNWHNWSQDIEPYIGLTHKDRFSSPIQLEGISQVQAKELIKNRLDSIELDATRIELFCENGWLEKQFDQGMPAVRKIIYAASNRFRLLQGKDIKLSEDNVSPKLDQLLKIRVNEIKASRPLQAYNQDVLMWWTQELSSFGKRKVTKGSEQKYFNTEWNDDGEVTRFAYEGGDNCRRWESMAKEAMELRKRDGKALSIVIRTPDLSKLPKPSWKKIKTVMEQAYAHGLVIHELATEQVCEMYAARDLYSDAFEGNIDYTPKAVLSWLQNYFQKAIANLTVVLGKDAAKEAPAVQPVKLSDLHIKGIVDLVQKKRFVPLKSVLKELSLSVDFEQTVLDAVGKIPNIKAHPGPKTILLQWRVKV